MSDLVIVLGDRGSGKTLSALRRMTIRKKQGALAYTNFPVSNDIPHMLLKPEHFIVSTEIQRARSTKTEKNVNWHFWKKVMQRHEKSKQPFDVYIDEAHNVISSRSAMSKENQLYSRWVSQLRKILGEHHNNSCCIISQTLRKIDINFRDMADYLTVCNKYKLKGAGTFHTQHTWESRHLKLAVDHYLEGAKPHKYDAFFGQPYYKLYDTRYVVDFE